MIYLALAGPWLALAFLLVMQQLERWLDDSMWEDVPPTPQKERPRVREMDVRLSTPKPGARSVSRSG